MQVGSRPPRAVVTILFALAAAGLALSAKAVDPVTLEGSFVWLRDGEKTTGDLQAVLTPTGDNEWAVAFHFVWEDGPHTYLGSASGTLGEGSLSGTAESDDPQHQISFRFRGEFENGTFRGTHGYVKKDGTLEPAGTLTLAAVE